MENKEGINVSKVRGLHVQRVGVVGETWGRSRACGYIVMRHGRPYDHGHVCIWMAHMDMGANEHGHMIAWGHGGWVDWK